MLVACCNSTDLDPVLAEGRPSHHEPPHVGLAPPATLWWWMLLLLVLWKWHSPEVGGGVRREPSDELSPGFFRASTSAAAAAAAATATATCLPVRRRPGTPREA